MHDLDSSEKYLLVGAFGTAIVDLALEANFQYQAGQGKTPEPAWLYQLVAEGYLPNVDDWVAGAGVPLVLYLIGKGMKNEKLVTLAKGGGIYGASMLTGMTAARAAIYGTGTWTLVKGRVG